MLSRRSCWRTLRSITSCVRIADPVGLVRTSDARFVLGVLVLVFYAAEGGSNLTNGVYSSRHKLLDLVFPVNMCKNAFMRRLLSTTSVSYPKLDISFLRFFLIWKLVCQLHSFNYYNFFLLSLYILK